MNQSVDMPYGQVQGTWPIKDQDRETTLWKRISKRLSQVYGLKESNLKLATDLAFHAVQYE